MPGMGSGVVQAGGLPVSTPPGTMMPPNAITPPGVPLAPGAIQPVNYQKIPGAVAAVGAITGPMPGRSAVQRTEVRFTNPAGMKITWATGAPGCATVFPGSQLEAPGRYNFMQGAIYRLKLTEIPNRPGLELYPTLEVVPSTPRTDAFLAHSSVPVAFTEEDFEQVAAGNYVVKVIYLPDPQYQDLATGGPDEVVSSRLEPGVDPIAEAHRRGCILLIIRMGNIDLEAPNTPAMDAPGPGCFAGRPGPPMPNMPPGMNGGMMAPGMQGPGPMVPYGAMGPGGPMMGQGGPMMGPNGPMMGQGGPMMGPNGPMMGQGGPMMGPNGPMMGQGGPMMGPNGPMMTPNGPMMGTPGMPRPNMIPSGQGMPGMPTGNAAPQQMTPPAKPVTMGTDKQDVLPTQYPNPPAPVPAAPAPVSAATTTVVPNPPAASPAPASSKSPSSGWIWNTLKKSDASKSATPAQPAASTTGAAKPAEKAAIQPVQYQSPSPTTPAPAAAPAPVVHHEEAVAPVVNSSSSNKGWVWFGLRKGNNCNGDGCKECAKPAPAPPPAPVPAPAHSQATAQAIPAAECDDKCPCDKRWKIFENPFKPNPPATPQHDQKDNCTPSNAVPATSAMP
jgi:hypothetical protein